MSKRAFATFVGRYGLSLLLFLIPRESDAIILFLPGSTVTNPATLSASALYADMETDATGNVYIPGGGTGVLKMTPQGATSTWSSAGVFDLAFAPDGTAYGAGRSLCDCVYKINPDGSSSTLHQDSYHWTCLTVTPDGVLYADLATGPGEGLYRIDRVTGEVNPVFVGGPGPGGLGSLGHLSFGVDGKLYLNGNDGVADRLYRLDGSALTPIDLPPYGEAFVTAGPHSLDILNVFHNGFGELWLYNPATGLSNLLARTEEVNQGFNAVAYDPAGGLIYALQNHTTIWAISADLATPAQTSSWGTIKARYHR